jgi:carbonic anhydrase/acetyltransferase-like protein (isoleucine patch superfamily)
MAIYRLEDKVPQIGNETYVSADASVIGDVVIGERCFIGPGAKIKGDYGSIRIGDDTSVQENCVMHARPDDVCTVGSMVNVGHGSILHNCTVKDFAIIGMGAIVSDFAEIGVWAVVGEGAVVKSKQKIADGEIAVGVPAKVVGTVDKAYKDMWGKYKLLYPELARRYSKDLERID